MDKKKKLSISIASLILLCFCLSVTSFALGYTVFKVENNRFRTGGIGIDLNGGQPIITEDEFLFEPGMTVEKPFYIKNNGTWAVYYKLYFSDVKGELGDVLDITITDSNGTQLIKGKMSELTEKKVKALESQLDVGQKQELKAVFHFPEEAGNQWKNGSVSFEMSAIAVQTKNNPNKEFD